MPFRPSPNSQLAIRNNGFTICEHPAAPGMVHGQSGRRATVYRVKNARGEQFALKVFTNAFRTSQTETGAQRIRAFAALPGLQVCSRLVLTRSNDAELLTNFPDLEFAALMPWVDGQTWQEMMLGHQPLTPQQSLSLAQNFASILSTMEQNGIAHCDLSGPNILIAGVNVALVDVEDLYAPGLEQPAKLPGGSAGYGHKTAASGLWSVEADRFAGAVLIAEMLGWCDERVRRIAVGEQFFASGELQETCDRYQLLSQSLKEKWGEEAANLLNRAWYSQTLLDCPTLAEWLSLLSSLQQQASIAQELTAPVPAGGPVVRWRNIGPESANQQLASQTAVAALIKTADNLVAQGNTDGALGVLRQAREMASPEELNEVNEKIVKVYEKQNFSAPPPQPTKPRPQPIPHPTPVPEQLNSNAADDRPQSNEKKWFWGLTGFFILGLLAIGVIGMITRPPTPTPNFPTKTKPVQVYATRTKAPPTPTKIRVSTSTPSKSRPVSTSTPVKQTTSGKQTTSKLQSCSTSAGDVCIYSVAPQSNGLIIALKFKQTLNANSLPTLTVAGKKFKCERLSTYPDRLYCNGSSVTGNNELRVYSSSNQLLASGTVNVPKYIPPSPTRRKSNNTYP